MLIASSSKSAPPSPEFRHEPEFCRAPRPNRERHLALDQPGPPPTLPGMSQAETAGALAPASPESTPGLAWFCVRSQIRHEHIAAAMTPGDVVQIAGGPLHGLEAVIAQVMPARRRVAVLLEFLGHRVMLELDAASVIPRRLRL